MLPHRSVVACAVAALIPRTVQAQSPEAPAVEQKPSHWLELLGEVGLAGPGFWTDTSSNQSLGMTVGAAGLLHLGQGWSVGLFGEWTRLSWTPEAGRSAYVDTWVFGPEVRVTFTPQARILPHAYFGFGYGIVSPSRISPATTTASGMAVRGGVGLDLRVAPRFRVGVSVGLTGMSLWGGTQMLGSEPAEPGNVWGLRLGGRAELL
jgi:hypothetical protein